MSVGQPRVFYKPADIARAKANLEAHAWAHRALADLKAVADPWLLRSDSYIRGLVPEASPLGERSCHCPVHGGGPAEWAWSLDEPDVLRCGRGGEVYPNAEFPDDGSGWVDERPGSDFAGKRFFFLGRCRGYLFEKLEEAASALAVVAALTGDPRYGEKAAVILDRIAEVYPGYDPHDNADGTLAYGGKIHSNTLVESYAALRFAKAYDLVAASGALAEGPRRRRIVDRLLVPMAERLKYSVDHFYRAPEFPQPMNIHAWLAAGMAALGVAVGREDFVAFALDSPRGFHEMMDRCVFADGIWFEGAPSYNVFTVEALYQLAEATLGYTDALHPEPLNLYADSRFRLMFRAPVAMLMPNGVLPPLGDSHAGERLPSWFFEVAYDRYGDPELAELLVESLGSPEARQGEFALFHARPLPAGAGEQGQRPRASVNLPELGCAILRTSPGSGRLEHQAALYLDYGAFRNEHSHYDLLNVMVFAEEREIVSDFGYIYWDHPLRAAWMQTTASHNTVVVDAGQQARVGGRLLAFRPGKEVQVVEVAADQAYPSTRLYRRSLALVEVGAGQAYVVDFFRVAGGSRHEWFLHAQGRDLTVTGVTLAPAQGKPGDGPGYDFISLARRGKSGGDGFCRALFAGEAGEPSLRLHFRQPPSGEVLVGSAVGQRFPVADEGARVPVLVLRNEADVSQFISVWEPYRDKPFVCEVKPLEVRPAAGVPEQPGPPFAMGLRVLLADGTEDLILAQEPGEGSPVPMVARTAAGEVTWQERLTIRRRFGLS